jgi:hypothetical protein
MWRRIWRTVWLVARESIAGSGASHTAIQWINVLLTVCAATIGYSFPAWARAFGYDVGPMAGSLAATTLVLLCGALRVAWRLAEMEEGAANTFSIVKVNFWQEKNDNGRINSFANFYAQNTGDQKVMMRIGGGRFYASQKEKAIEPRDWIEVFPGTPQDIEEFITDCADYGPMQAWIELHVDTCPRTRTHKYRRCFVGVHNRVAVVPWWKRHFMPLDKPMDEMPPPRKHPSRRPGND